jgi:flagellar biosynthesis protein FlhF
MTTKTYQAETMMQALKLVQEEMGSEAIVLSVRDVQMGLWRRTGVEVVAITPDMLNKSSEKKEPKIPADPAPILRQSATGKGIEFIEEVPEIEWDDPAPASAAPRSKTAPGKEREESPQGWRPQRIRREDIATIDRAALFRGDSSALSPRAAAGSQESVPQGAGSLEKSRPAVQLKNMSLTEAMQKIQRQLALQGVEREYLDDLARVVAQGVPASAQQDEASLRAWAGDELAGELVIAANPAPKTAGQSIVLVGASGNGKTSTIAKLAFYYSHVQGKKVVWISADTIRTGAIAETRAYTDALGIPLRLVYTVEDLKAVFPPKNEADICLVDMPGYNPYSEGQMVELGAVLTEVPNRSTYLVAAATTKDADMNQAVAALGLFTLDGLIVTRLDETLTFGSAYNLARSSKLPLAFFTTGKEANGNLLIADPRRLVSALFGKGWVK